MSVEGDQDFAMSLVRQTTELLAKTLNPIKVKQTHESGRITELENEVKILKGIIQEKDKTLKDIVGRVELLEAGRGVKDQLSLALTAGLTALNFPPELTATPIFSPISTPQSQVQMTESNPKPSKKRKSLIPETSTFITDIDDVSIDLREHLRPYLTADPRATCDLLNPLQRAFVKYQAKRHYATGESLSKAVVARVIFEGKEALIWNSDFNPSDSEQFDQYIHTRMKNEKRRLRHQGALDSQSDMLCSFMSLPLESE